MYIIRHNEFVTNILEKQYPGKKKAVGRLRLQYLKQVGRNTGVDSSNDKNVLKQIQMESC
jgi:hypothetical protein